MMSAPPLGDYTAMPPASSTSEYHNSHSPHMSSSATQHTRHQNERDHFTMAMGNFNMNPQAVSPASMSMSMMDPTWPSAMYDNNTDGQSVVNIRDWMSGGFAHAPDVEEASLAPTAKAQSIVNLVSNVLPTTSVVPPSALPAPSPAETTAPVTSPAVPPSQANKRRRTKGRDHEPSGTEQHKRKRGGLLSAKNPPPPARNPPPSHSPQHPTYPRAIPQEIRELVDNDFENSCEYCPFYLHEPLKHYPKPWSSCSKQRAEISHIITHIVSDHGLIRGCNRKRSNQRYITRCAGHDARQKGKAECTPCSRVEDWTAVEFDEAELKRHEGPSVCLRCYAELKTKRELHEHLHTPSICLYREDKMMKAKSRTLYEVFCSENEVPKFRPPPEAAARDGARKRNQKGGRRSGGRDASAVHAGGAQGGRSRSPSRVHRPIRSSPAQPPSQPSPQPLFQQQPLSQQQQPLSRPRHPSQPPSQAHSPLPPSLTPSLTRSPSSREESILESSEDNNSPNPFFSPIGPAQVLSGAQPHIKAQQLASQPMVPRLYTPRRPVPSLTSDLDWEMDLGPAPYHGLPHDLSHDLSRDLSQDLPQAPPSVLLSPCENSPAPPLTPIAQMGNQFLQPPGITMRGGDNKFNAFDSGIGTESIAIHSENAFDDTFLPETNAFVGMPRHESYFDNALGFDLMQTQALDYSLPFGRNWMHDQSS